MEDYLDNKSRASDIADGLLSLPFHLGGVLSGISLVIIYVLLAEWSYLFVLPPMKSSVFWMPSGINAFLCIFFRDHKKMWPYFMGAIFLAEAYVVSQHGIGTLAAALWGLSNVTLGLSMIFLSRKFLREDFSFQRVKDVFSFIWIVPLGVIPGSLLAALGTNYDFPETKYFESVLSWALSDALGIFLMAPVLFAWTSGSKFYGDRKEGLLLASLLITFSAVLFLHPGEKVIDRSFFSFLIFFAAWAAIRFGSRGVTLALIVIDIVQVWATVRGYGAFANLDLDPYQRLFTLQLFVTNLGVLMLILAAALEEQMDLRFRAESATRIRDDFISVASHELKTPLQSLKMELQILNNYIIKGQIRTISEEKLKRLARISDQELSRFAGLINSLLDVSRISSGKILLDTEDVDLLALVHAAVERQKTELEKSGSIITVTGIPNIHGQWDQARIDQVLTNLISNAIKYGNGLPIIIEVKEEGGYAVFSVTDHGVGIKREDQKRIFERFERAVPTRVYSGMGLGLFIANQIVEAHHGHIKVESMKGKGTIFKVQLPHSVKSDEIHPYWEGPKDYEGHIYH